MPQDPARLARCAAFFLLFAATAHAQPLPPRILTQPPATQAIRSTDTLRLWVQVSGDPVLRYQWHKDGASIAGATLDAYTVTNPTPADSGRYHAVISNAVGTVTSEVCAVAIKDLRIMTQLVDQHAAVGGSATFRVAVSATDPVEYHWFYSANGHEEEPGANSETFAIPTVGRDSGGYVSVYVQNEWFREGSHAQLHVDAPPVVTIPIRTRSAVVGQQVNLVAGVTGSAPLTYQWFKDGTAIAGATNEYLIFNSVQLGDTGNYTVEVRNAFGVAQSPPGRLTAFNITILGPRTKAYDGAPLTLSATTEPAGLNVQMSYTGSNGFLLAGPPTSPGDYVANAIVHDGIYDGVASAPLKITPVAVPITLSGLSQVYDGLPKIVRGASALASSVRITYNSFDTPVTDAGTHEIRAYPEGPGLTNADSSVHTLTVAKAAPLLAFKPLPTALILATPFPVGAYTHTGRPAVVTVASGNASISEGRLTLWDNNPVTLRAVYAADNNHHAATLDFTLSAAKRPQAITVTTPTYRVLGDGPLTLAGTATSGLPVTFTVESGPATLSGSTLTPTGTEGTVVLRARQDGNSDFNPAASVIQRIHFLSAAPPTITAQPISRTAYIDGEASFAAGVAGTGPFTYHWYLNARPLGTTPTPTITLRGLAYQAPGPIALLVLSPSAWIMTEPAMLSVEFPPDPTATRAFIKRTSPSELIFPGDVRSFSAEVAGSRPVYFQWHKNGTPIAAATRDMITIANMSPDQVGDYTVTATNSAGSMTSAPISVGMRPTTTTGAPVVVQDPQAQTLSPGDTTWLTVAVQGSTPMSFQWFKDGSALPGATTEWLSLGSLESAKLGLYHAVCTNSFGSATSRPARLAFLPDLTAPPPPPPAPPSPTAPAAPVITSAPPGGLFMPGERVIFTVAAEGTAPLTYEWRRENVPLPGATASTLTLPSIQQTDAGNYSAVVRNAYGEMPAGFRVQVSSVSGSNPPRPPAIVTPPVAQTVTEGSSVTFAVGVTGTEPLSYQWRRNGTPLADGHSPTLTLTNVQLTQAGNYEVSIVNPVGGITSTPVPLTVTPASPPPPPPAGTWQDVSIGGPIPAGSTTGDATTAAIRAAGADVWETSDSFHFRHQALSGDGEIIARVSSIDHTHGWAKAGVMIRESLQPGARHAFVFVTPGGITALQSRTASNATCTLNQTSWLSAPRWLRLTRQGAMLAGYQSDDGTNWMPLGSVPVDLPANAYIGLAVTSHVNGTLTTAAFDQISFRAAAPPPPISPPPAPTAPAAPSGLAATPLSSTAIALSWVDHADNETGFELQRSNDNVVFAPTATLGANVTSYAQSGLSAATTYYYRVRALLGPTPSALSSVAAATTFAVGAPPTTPPPPVTGTWDTRDIGPVAAAGSASESGGSVTVAGSGADIWDNADEFCFRYLTLSGDGQITARVTSLTTAHAWAKAGVMFREDLTPGARHALMALTAGERTAFQRRVTFGGSSASTGGALAKPPTWIRLTRSGNTFTGYESVDGITWSAVGTATLALPLTTYVGLAVTSHEDGVLSTATFADVSLAGTTSIPPATLSAPINLAATATSSTAVTLTWTDTSSGETGFIVERSTDNIIFVAAGTAPADTSTYTSSGLVASTTYYFRVRAAQGAATSSPSATASATTHAGAPPPPPPPAGWNSADIGAVAAAGSTSDTNGIVTLSGSGSDIWDARDEFRFHYQAFSGDGDIVARVTGLSPTDAWAKAGVMFRESLNADSRHAFMFVAAAAGTAFQRRVNGGANCDFMGGVLGSSLPRWLKLSRRGNTFSGYESADGLAWSLVSAVTLTMPSTIYVGLAVTSHQDGVLCTAVFDQVAVAGVASLPPPPAPGGPMTPSNLVARALSLSEVELTWTDNATDETEYQVERSLDNLSFVALQPQNAGTTRWTDVNRVASTTYYYRVRCFRGNLASDYSNIATITTPPDQPSTTAWEQVNLGTPSLNGSMDAAGNTITLRGSGRDIWDTTDHGRFLYRVLNGDCTVEARITSLTYTHSWAKAGVMIRESLEPGARNVFAFATPGQGVGVQTRQEANGASIFRPGPWGATLPYWVRLVRLGTGVTAYVSSDGINWTYLQAYFLPSVGSVYVGFAVTSHDDTQLATAVFTDPFIQ